MRGFLFVRSYANTTIVIVADRVRGALAPVAGIPLSGYIRSYAARLAADVAPKRQ